MHIFLLLFAAIQAPSGAESANLEKPAAQNPAWDLNPAQKLAHTILDSVQSNKERLQGLELTVTRDFRDRSVSESTRTETRLPDGGKIIEFRAPESQTVERVVVLGDRIRVDEKGEPTTPAVTYWYDGSRWTEADAGKRRVATMWPNQMGSRVFDPREVAGVDSQTSLSAILSDASLKDATVSTAGTVTSLTTTNTGGQKLIVDFDAKFGLLPVSSKLFHLNGAIVRDASVTYFHVASRDAWIIDQMVEHVYSESDDGLAQPERWKQESRTTVTHRPLKREEAESQLAVAVPDGFRTIDFTDPATLVRKESPRVPVVKNELTPLIWLLFANAALIPVGAGYFYWRKRQARLAGSLR